MKLKHRALALLLSLAISFSFMPAASFAAVPEGVSTKKVVELKYDGFTEYGTNEDGSAYYKRFKDPGNRITVVWDDGSSDVYVCKPYERKDYIGVTLCGYKYFPENQEPHLTMDSDGNEQVDNAADFKYSISSDGVITIQYKYTYYDEENGEQTLTAKSSFQGITPVSITYEGQPFTYAANEGPAMVKTHVPDAKFIVTYSDGTSRTIVSKAWTYSIGDFEKETVYSYFFENEEPIIKGGYDEWDVANGIIINFRTDLATETSLPVEYYNVKTTVPIEADSYLTPVSLELIQADGSTVNAKVGQDCFSAGDIGGKGNILRLTDAKGRVYDFSYYGENWWLFNDSRSSYSLRMYDIDLDERVPKGTNTVSGKVTVVNDEDQEFTLPINVKISASKDYAYVQQKSYTYTGKSIAPKVVVRYYNGKGMKTMPKSWYTSSVKRKSAAGAYEYKVTLKKKYQKKYGKYLTGRFYIVPKAPTIKSAYGGEGSLTVKWKKLSKSERRNVSGFVVEVSKDKTFSKGVISERIDWNTDSNMTIYMLDPGEQYYVRVRAYKNVKKKYGNCWSKPSKTKSAIVK